MKGSWWKPWTHPASGFFFSRNGLRFGVRFLPEPLGCRQQLLLPIPPAPKMFLYALPSVFDVSIWFCNFSKRSFISDVWVISFGTYLRFMNLVLSQYSCWLQVWFLTRANVFPLLHDAHFGCVLCDCNIGGFLGGGLMRPELQVNYSHRSSSE